MKISLTAEHTRYFSASNRRLCGVTTYLGGLSKDHLLPWYARMERDGILALMATANAPMTADDLRRWLPTREGKPAWFAESKRDRAADLGTVVHAMFQGWITNDPLEHDGIGDALWAAAQPGFERVKAWWNASGFTLVASELVVICPGPREYGGTIDILATDGEGRTVLVDLKTSKASPWWPYDETFGQVAAYANAGPANVHRVIVARIGKEEVDEVQAVELTTDERAEGWALFCAAHDAYEAKRRLTKARKRGGK